jgi:hypothetical protein
VCQAYWRVGSGSSVMKSGPAHAALVVNSAIPQANEPQGFMP